MSCKCNPAINCHRSGQSKPTIPNLEVAARTHVIALIPRTGVKSQIGFEKNASWVTAYKKPPSGELTYKIIITTNQQSKLVWYLDDEENTLYTLIKHYFIPRIKYQLQIKRGTNQEAVLNDCIKELRTIANNVRDQGRKQHLTAAEHTSLSYKLAPESPTSIQYYIDTYTALTKVSHNPIIRSAIPMPYLAGTTRALIKALKNELYALVCLNLGADKVEKVGFKRK